MAEEEKFEEQPTLDEEVTQTEDVIEADESEIETKATDEVSQLIAELRKGGEKATKKVQGLMTASQETGNLANMVGQLKQELLDTQTALAVEKGRSPVAEEDYSSGESIDLAQTIDNVLDKREKRQSEQVMKVQQQNMAQWNYIQNDEDYVHVKDVWEDKLRDPAFVYKIQQGQVNPLMEYQETVRDFYKGWLNKSADAIELLKKGGKTEIPFIETGERTPETAKEVPANSREAKLKKVRDKVAKDGRISSSNEEEVFDAIDAVIGNL